VQVSAPFGNVKYALEVLSAIDNGNKIPEAVSAVTSE